MHRPSILDDGFEKHEPPSRWVEHATDKRPHCVALRRRAAFVGALGTRAMVGQADVGWHLEFISGALTSSPVSPRMAKNRMQFQDGWSLRAILRQDGTEDRCADVLFDRRGGRKSSAIRDAGTPGTFVALPTSDLIQRKH
jgi:hypothetical protein